MRSKLIITGAIGVLAAATLTVNAQNAAGRTNATRPSTATLAAHTVAADREEVAIFVHATASPEAAATTAATPDSEQSSKPDTDSKPASTAAVSTQCQSAIAALKSMHQADVAEDASERMAAESQTSAATATGDKTEDAGEAQKWMAALSGARTACEPQPIARCLPALSTLQTVLQTLRAQEAAEPQAAEMLDAAADFSAVRSAFSAVAMSCADRE